MDPSQFRNTDATGSNHDDDVVDAEFTEVDEDKKGNYLMFKADLIVN